MLFTALLTKFHEPPSRTRSVAYDFQTFDPSDVEETFFFGILGLDPRTVEKGSGFRLRIS